jgi:flagellar M-ring protein FliF
VVVYRAEAHWLERFVQNLLSFWSALDLRRRVVIVVATVAMFAAVLGMSRMATTPRMELLYSGLDPAAAGEVIAALEQGGTTYEVRGAAIYVDGAQRDELRLTLAAQGLPAAGTAGYELLDSLSGFGTTSQMFDAAYWRAKEGELARTILAIPQIRAARVHISRADPQPFRRPDRQTASVTVTTSAGMLSAGQAKALKHLVASAVAGMTPDDVSIIDSASGLVELGDDGSVSGMSAMQRGEDLKHNVERLLEARVGQGNAVVEVSVDVVTESESITERRFDPDNRVAISTDTEEKTGSSTDPGGQVTVASNLPEGDAAASAAGRSSNTESRERVNFEVSETKREVLRTPGAIRKLSVAVLVDDARMPAADGTITQQPRPQDELDVLRDLVASAVGFDEARGDIITLRSLAFDAAPELGTLAEADMMSGIDMMSIIQMAVLAVVTLVLALFVLRPMIMTQRRLGELPAPSIALALPGLASGSTGPGETTRILTGEIHDGRDLPPLSIVSRDDLDTSLPADPVARLRRLIEERQAESVEILRGWMEDREEKA